MSRPFSLYVSYGMPKSGSTLAFELVRTMLELAGKAQPILSEEFVEPHHGINFIQTLDGPAVRAASETAALLDGPLVVKTHSRIFPAVKKRLGNGHMIGHAVCRDPRDIALSMLDAGREGRAWGGGSEGTFKNVIDAIPALRSHVKKFVEWAECDQIIPIHYEQLAFNTMATAERIAAQFKLDVDVGKAVHIVSRERFTQKNRGVPQRWKNEMKPQDAALIADEFSDFIQTYCSDIPDVPVKRVSTGRGFLLGLFRGKKADS